MYMQSMVYGTNHPQLEWYTRVTCVCPVWHISAVATYVCVHTQSCVNMHIQSLHTQSLYKHVFLYVAIKTH